MKEYCSVCTVKYNQEITVTDGVCQYCKSGVVNVATAIEGLRTNSNEVRRNRFRIDHLELKVCELENKVRWIIKDGKSENRSWLYKFIWGDY